VDTQAFANLLAQVVPVALLALAVETRSHHRTFQEILSNRTKPDPKSTGGMRIWPDVIEEPIKFRQLLFSYLSALYGLMALFSLIEVSALAVSVFPSPGRIPALLASPKVSIMIVGFGFAFASILSALSTNQMYVQLKVISDRDRRALHWPLSIVAGIVVVFGVVVVSHAS
jgi:hypothetical protein